VIDLVADAKVKMALKSEVLRHLKGLLRLAREYDRRGKVL